MKCGNKSQKISRRAILNRKQRSKFLEKTFFLFLAWNHSKPDKKAHIKRLQMEQNLQQAKCDPNGAKNVREKLL